MACPICVKLEEAVLSARVPDSPDRLLGLSEPGKRNRAHQREEHLVQLEIDLEKHKKWCTKKAEGSLIEN
jgi:phage replication-related protein YjqB (UPF0714/DUF867 family)